jgi:hypothetical protein
MLKTFYKVVLNLSNDQKLPITVATADINRIQPLVESNKVLYAKDGNVVTGFVIDSTKYPLGMTPEKYEEELIYCDIVDEGY